MIETNIPNKKVRVLIVDDSALVREILSKGLAGDPGIEVIGTAPDVYIARDLIVQKRPDVLTLDIEMPKMDGIEFLRKLMPQFPLPVVVVSSLTQKGKDITLQALEAGAVDYVPKPMSNVSEGLMAMITELRTKIKIASTANVSHWKNRTIDQEQESKPNITGSRALSESTDKLIAIGASTGGTEAIRKVISVLPPNTPGIVIVQHIPSGFSKAFADRLNQVSMMIVKEAEDGDRIMNGRVLVAPGDFHMTVERSGGRYIVKLNQAEKVNGHRPSVDVLFKSVAQYVGANAYGVILTGMGNDGAYGLKLMKQNGAKTIGQNQATSVVYGMPKVAYEIGAIDIQLPLDDISKKLINQIEQDKKLFEGKR